MPLATPARAVMSAMRVSGNGVSAKTFLAASTSVAAAFGGHGR